MRKIMVKLTTAFWATMAIARMDLQESLGRPVSFFVVVFTACMSLVTIALILSGTGISMSSRLIYLFPALVTVLGLSGLALLPGMIRADMQSGTVTLLVHSPSPPQVLLFGHLVGMLGRVLVQMFFLFAMTMLLVNRFAVGSPEALVSAIGAVILSVVLYGSIGAICAVANPVPGLTQVVNMIAMSISIIASTAYFPIERVPKALRGFAEINPVSFVCEAMRYAFCTDCREMSWRPVVVVLLETTVALVVACFAFRRLDRSVGH